MKENRLTYSELGKAATELLGNETELSQLHLLTTTLFAEDSVLQPAIALRHIHAFEYINSKTNAVVYLRLYI